MVTDRGSITTWSAVSPLTQQLQTPTSTPLFRASHSSQPPFFGSPSRIGRRSDPLQFQSRSLWTSADFAKTSLTPLSCIIIEADGSEREASLDECIEADLEPEGVWDAPHIHERLLAHFQGKKSTSFEHAKLIIPESHRKR